MFNELERPTCKYWNNIKKDTETDCENIDLVQLAFVNTELILLTLRREHRLGVFENRVLRRLLGPKK
jgi:hypothetical protein